MFKYIVATLLFAAVLLAQDRTQISIRVDRGLANADSLVAAAIEIEPKLALSQARNRQHITVSYTADSLADTLQFSGLREIEGVELFWSVDSGGG